MFTLHKKVRERIIVMTRILMSNPLSYIDSKDFRPIELETDVSSFVPQLRMAIASTKKTKPVRPLIAF